MRASLELFALASFALGLAQAQLNGLPTCAQSCVSQYTTGGDIGGCKKLDIKCICSSGTFLSGIACCLEGACDQADQQAAVSFALTFCKAAGVTGLPTAVSCTSSVSFTGSSAAPSGSSSSGSSSPVPSTTTGGSSSSAPSSAASAASTSASNSQRSSSSASSEASVATSNASAASSGGSATGSSTAPTSTHNAGHRHGAEMGGAAGVLGGLIAAAVML